MLRTAFIVALAIQATPPGFAPSPAESDQRNSYGALAKGDDGPTDTGWAYDWPTQAEADAAALRGCFDCVIVFRFWNTCAAYSYHHNGANGWADAPRPYDAARLADQQCERSGGERGHCITWHQGCSTAR